MHHKSKRKCFESRNLFEVVKPSLREDVGNKLGFKETNKFGFNRKHYGIKLIIVLGES